MKTYCDTNLKWLYIALVCVIISILCVAGTQKPVLSVGTHTAKNHHMIPWQRDLAQYEHLHQAPTVVLIIWCLFHSSLFWELISNGSTGWRQQQDISSMAVSCNFTWHTQNFILVTSGLERNMCTGSSLLSLLCIWIPLFKSVLC